MPWEYLPETKDDNAALRKPDGGYEAVFYEGDAPDKATGDMWAEALNVREATGRTPQQLQARVAELEAALSRARHETLVECAEICRAVGSRDTQFEADDCADEIEELLSK